MMMITRSLAAAAALLALAAVGASAAPNHFESGVFTELNRFRGDPAGYTKFLREYRPRFDGELLVSDDDSEIDIMTREGVAAVDEAIRDLRGEKPLSELTWSDTLARAAADHVAAQSRSGAVGHYTRVAAPASG